MDFQFKTYLVSILVLYFVHLAKRYVSYVYEIVFGVVSGSQSTGLLWILLQVHHWE